MKKILTALFVVFVSFSLASCGPKDSIKELEIDGEKMSVRQMEKLATEYEEFFEDYEENIDRVETNAGWYSLSVDFIAEGSVDGDYDYEKNVKLRDNIDLKASLDGKFYESSFAYEAKAKVTLKVEFDYTKETLEGNYEDYSGKMSISAVLVEGICYVKFDGKVSSDDATVSVDGKYFMEAEDVDYEEVSSTMSEAGFYIMQAVQKIVTEIDAFEQEGINIDMFETKKGVGIVADGYIEDLSDPKQSMTFKGAIDYELEEDTYELKAAEAYVDFEQNDLRVIVRGELKEAMFGSVSKPMNSGSYRPNDGDIEDALSQIFPFNL